MADVAAIDLPHPEWDAKNLLVHDDKRRNYYLITVRAEKRVDLKRFRHERGTRPLSFASPEELLELMGLTPGSVTPLGLLNDKGRRVAFFLDESFLGQIIGVHPNDNTATVWLRADDLLGIVREHGNQASAVAI